MNGRNRYILGSLLGKWGTEFTSTLDPATWDERYSQLTLSYNNDLYMIFGYKGWSGGGQTTEVWKSTDDGASWTSLTLGITPGGRLNHAGCVHDGKMWVSCGIDGVSIQQDIWYSTTGASWTKATESVSGLKRQYHTMLSYDDKLWLIGGSTTLGNKLSDVWSSTDGESWTEVTSSAPWGGLEMHSSVVFNGKMWVIGGINGIGEVNSVWSSTNGSSWTEEIATGSAPWLERKQHKCCVFNGAIWLTGGYDLNGLFKNDVWYSYDGVNWTQFTSSANWGARRQHSCVSHNGKLFVIAGYGDGDFYDDVWELE